MIILSLNSWVLGGTQKFPPLKRLVQFHKLDVTIFQETMCVGAKEEEACRPWLKG